MFLKEEIKGASHNPAPSSVKNVEWNTHTCTFGWPVQGIYAPDQDGTDVNICAINNDKTLVATGDDYGYVNLYNYPCLDSVKQQNYFSFFL